MSIFHPDFMLWRMDEALRVGEERFEQYTPEERQKFFRRLGWVDENGLATPQLELLRRAIQQSENQ